MRIFAVAGFVATGIGAMIEIALTGLVMPGAIFGAIPLAIAALLVACGGSGQAAAEKPATPTIHYTPEPTAVPSQVAITAQPSPTATPPPDWNALPVAANNPADLAKQIVVVEAALRDPQVQGAQLAYMGHLQQLVYSRLQD